MARGKDLASKNGVGIMSLDSWYNLDANELSRRRHNIGEAIRAFQTVLLLQPTNGEARIVQRGQLTTGRLDEALNYCREVLENRLGRVVVWNLQTSLHYSFPGEPEEKARWFETALQQATNTPSREYFRREAEQAEKELVADSGGAPAQELAEKSYLKTVYRVGGGQGWRLGTENSLNHAGQTRPRRLDAC